MANFLLDLDPEQLVPVVLHPEQVAMARVIGRLLAELRAARNDTDAWYDFEARLFRVRYRADAARLRARRASKRVASLKPPGWTDPHPVDVEEFIEPAWRTVCDSDSRSIDDWDREARVAERVSRQLASVGDALAWRVFRYDRRVITALASNAPAGPFVDKIGLGYEVGAILERRERGNFSLMHDLTSVIRHVDITEVHPNGYRELHEIKANAKASRSRQIKAGQAALDAASGAAPLPIGSRDRYVHRVTTPFRTTSRALAGPIDAARRDGFFIGYHADRVLTILDVCRMAEIGPSMTVEEQAVAHDALLGTRWPGSHTFRAFSGDLAARNPAMIPFGMYPLAVETCADLTCDQLILMISVAYPVLEAALSRPDHQVRLVASPGVTDGDTPVIEIRSNRKAMLIPIGCVNQTLLEFIDTARWAQAVWELFDTSNRANSILTFSNERAEVR